jgi:hypothetical protein
MAAHASRAWEQGRVEPPSRSGGRVLAVAAGAVALGVVLAAVPFLASPVAFLSPGTGVQPAPPPADDGRADLPPPDAGPAAAPPEESDAAGDVALADALAQAPEVRTGLAFLEIGDPLELAEAVFGPSDQQMEDINAATSHTWLLEDGGEVGVSVAGDLGILGLYAAAPVGSDHRPTAWGGIVVGESTPAEIAETWGAAYDLPEAGGDFVLRYIECVGPWPVVVKFDQDGAGPDLRWDEPVTSVMIGLVDADPGTEGCPRQRT